MSANLTRKPILLQSFENAALSVPFKRDAMKIPVAANGAEETASHDSIFRNTEK
jgi:hypothetical protein